MPDIRFSDAPLATAVAADTIFPSSRDPSGANIDERVPAELLARAMQRANVRTEVANTAVTNAHLGEHLLLFVSGSDLTAVLADSCTVNHRSWVTKIYTGGSDPGGNVLIAGVDGDHHLTGPTVISRVGDTIECLLVGIDGADYYWILTYIPAYVPAPRLTEQVVISASRDLTDADAGKVLVCDTSGGAVTLTAPHTLVADWSALVIREGANNAIINGSGGQTLVGPAASGGTVTLAVDDGAVTLVRRSATRVWAAGVIA